jgi:hypothetical protein
MPSRKGSFTMIDFTLEKSYAQAKPVASRGSEKQELLHQIFMLKKEILKLNAQIFKMATCDNCNIKHELPMHNDLVKTLSCKWFNKNPCDKWSWR